MRPPLALESS